MRGLFSHLALALLIALWGAQPRMLAPEQPEIELGKMDSAGAQRFSFRISDTLSYRGTGAPAGERTWRGTLDEDGGTFTAIERDGRRAARIHLADRTLEIVRSRTGRELAVHTIDHATLPRFCSAGEPPPPGPPISAAAVTSSCSSPQNPECDDATGAMSGDEQTSEAACGTDPPNTAKLSWIDVMVAYTAAVERQYGPWGVADLADLSMAETNAAFEISGINARVRPAKRQLFWWQQECVRKIEYEETGSFRVDLDRLLYQGDGFLDGIRPVRNACRADLVILLVNKSCDGTQGIACVMKHLSPSYGDYAMGIVLAPSAVAHYTFTHEIGHMMGGGHQGNTRTGMCDYSKGHQFEIFIPFTTLMYNDSTRRVPYVSNPHVSVPGKQAPGIPVGNPFGIPVGTVNADNARTLRIAAPTVATFR